jgi:hypothetical protein
VWIGTSCGTFAGAHGLQNTFVGSSCAYSNGGSYNSFLGANAGVCNTTGSNNTFVGFVSGEFSTSCQDDTLIGSHAGENTTTGGANVAVGYSSSQANTTGENNTALGAYALNANSSSSDNTAVGYGALLSSTGANNIGIGYKAGANLTLSTSSNNIYIFAALQNGLVDESNVTRIGELQTACYLAGTVISSNGFASFLTNVLSPAANAWSTRSSTLNSGWTNNLGTNMVANVSGTSGSVIFWNRGGPGGGTSAANPLWTNTVPYNFAVGANCGFQVVNGSGVYAQVYAP